MEVVTGAISTLLPKLGDLLKGEYKLQKGVRGGIMFLEAELESMQAALLKVSEAPIDQPPDKQVKLWARDVKDLSYDVEDTIDAFMVRVDTHAPKKLHGLRGFINRSLNLLTKSPVRHKIGTDIENIKRRITEIRERHDRYKVDTVAAKPIGPTIDILRRSALYKEAIELVGMEVKSDGLIKRLMEGDEASKQQLKIVSIVGFGGLGKTTLANVVYQKLKEQFDCGAFISVSLNPNMEKIFKNMLHQLGKHSNIDDEAQLINELRDFLRNKSEEDGCGFTDVQAGKEVMGNRIIDTAHLMRGLYYKRNPQARSSSSNISIESYFEELAMDEHASSFILFYFYQLCFVFELLYIDWRVVQYLYSLSVANT